MAIDFKSLNEYVFLKLKFYWIKLKCSEDDSIRNAQHVPIRGTVKKNLSSV